MKEIKLTQGKVALVDDADFDWLNSVKWYAEADTHNFYARRNITTGPNRQRKYYMHGLLAAVMGFSRPDHKDGNGLNNQRDNLRSATNSQNSANRRLPSDNKTGYRGVRWCRGKWEANITFGGKTHYLGRFETPEDAALKYDEAARKQFGAFARLNFPNETPALQ